MKPVPERFESLRSFIQETCDSTDTNLAGKVKGFLEQFSHRLREAFKGVKPGTREAWFLSQQANRFEKARDMWTTALAEASETAGRAEGNAEGGEIRHSLRSNKYEDYDKPITSADIETLRGIGRKSVNAFTSEDTLKSQKWAHKFYKQMGTKSPFFRAWYGDWRANDATRIGYTDVETIDISVNDIQSERGMFNNADTKWEIVSGSLGEGETKRYAKGNMVSTKMLTAAKAILENAVLLDTEVSAKDSGKKHNDTAFMHKLYTPVRYNGSAYIAKISIEEYGADSRRLYHLHGIEIEPADNRSDGNAALSNGSDAGSISNVSDLYALVKQYDKDFHSKDVHPALLNPDGTPKVLYHGTNYTFTQFKPRDSVNEFFFTNDINAARDYGEKQMSVYLKMSNPYEIDLQGMGDVAIYDALDHAHDNNYDGVIARNAYDGANTHNEYVVFSPTQIKSATDNIGTFDGNNPDIRYSLRESNIDDYTEAEYNKRAWARVNGVISAAENKTFSQCLSDKQNGASPQRTSDGKYIFAVGDKFGVNNVLIVSDGNYVSPSIERVYRIELDNETDIDRIRRGIYEQEQRDSTRTRGYVQQVWRSELVNTYSRYDMSTYRELRSERRRNAGSGSGKNKRYYRFEQDGSGDNGEVEQTVKPQLRTTSESDAEFFVR